MERTTSAIADAPPASSTRAEPMDITGTSPLTRLLESVGSASPADGNREQENQLAQVRLGLASSLFYAIRAKHAPTAAHCLRVALGCSSWSQYLEMSPQARDEVEVAALLHDVGKIGVPDHLLMKSDKLSSEESQVVERHHALAREILSGCCVSANILEAIHYAPARFDGQKPGYDRQGEQLPLAARVLAIVDAFDSMTMEHVYRRAFSPEEAMAELYERGGEQFDPRLVKGFCELLSCDRIQFRSGAARRWLEELSPDTSNAFWQRGAATPQNTGSSVDRLFYRKLLEGLHDGVVFVDSSLRIMVWSPAAQRLTGIAGRSVQHKRWSPRLIEMRDENGVQLSGERCPLTQALQTGVQAKRRLTITGRNGKPLSVDARMVPVFGRDGAAYGATLVLHDASTRITLEERVQTLHERATRDPLTQVANRAELDRVLKQFIDTHLEQYVPCSLIICDLDRFKRINDVYGHQAGDEALVCFAKLLRRSCRPADLVARYGGEEFVLLCADCDNVTATERAEELRRELAEIPQPSLNGKSLTASFGVTEIQDGDTSETMVRRADRALLQAKETGRNRVVQLGSGISKRHDDSPRGGWFRWWSSSTPNELVEQRLVTAVPLKVAVEKLRGFVADHHADIVTVADETIVLHIAGSHAALLRRASDRPVPYHITLTFSETRFQPEGHPEYESLRTLVNVSVRPKRNRDRRRADVLERARQLLASLKSYLMAQDFTGPQDSETANCQ